jgi:hypothetical protein
LCLTQSGCLNNDGEPLEETIEAWYGDDKEFNEGIPIIEEEVVEGITSLAPLTPGEYEMVGLSLGFIERGEYFCQFP